MGAHVNYYSLIYYLVVLKRELYRLDKEKYKKVIEELNGYEIQANSDNDHLPDQKVLARKFNYSQSKMNSILRDLFAELINALSNPPLVIKDLVHILHIHIPYDERDELSKDAKEQMMRESIWIELVLPSTPRIGEEIRIPFIEHAGKWHSGYVHSVRHSIKGTTQEVYLEVHPFHNYYHKWNKMEEEYKYWKRWTESMKRQEK
jgi:hypothetical protein